MLFFAIPNLNNEEPYENSKMHEIRTMVVEQLNDLTMLCTIAEYLNGFQQQGIDAADTRKYRSKITAIEDNQQKRFARIDEFINENIIAIKKQQTTSKVILNAGKEVRKLEAGIRTLKLFITDVVNMLEPNSTLQNRTHERLYYFNKRSASLEVEMKALQEKLSLL